MDNRRGKATHAPETRLLRLATASRGKNGFNPRAGAEDQPSRLRIVGVVGAR